MEVEIEITLDDDKNIKIVDNNSHNLVIKKEEMTIRAEDLYNFLSYKNGAIYKLKKLSIDNDSSEYKIVKPLYDLISKLIDQVNDINNQDEIKDDIELDSNSIE